MKEEFLELLEKDREFRLAVAGLVGYREVLERLHEHDKRFEEILRRLEDHDRKFNEILARLEQHDKKFEEVFRRLEEHDRKFNEILARLEQHDKRFEEILRRLEDHDRKFNEILEETKMLRERVEVTIGSMGRRWGEDLEETVLGIFKETLERQGIEPGKVEKLRYKDFDGSITGVRGRILDVDVVVHDGYVYVIEVKSRAELEHVEMLPEKAKAVEKLLKRPVKKLMIVAVNVDREALERAKDLGIDVVAGNVLG